MSVQQVNNFFQKLESFHDSYSEFVKYIVSLSQELVSFDREKVINDYVNHKFITLNFRVTNTDSILFDKIASSIGAYKYSFASIVRSNDYTDLVLIRFHFKDPDVQNA